MIDDTVAIDNFGGRSDEYLRGFEAGAQTNVAGKLIAQRDAEIASLRAQVDSYRDLAGEQQTKWATRCTTAEADIASLRAELAETRRDAAERVVLLGGERDYLRAELAEVKMELNIAWSTAKVEAGLKDKARAAARQDAEEKARLTNLLERLCLACPNPRDPTAYLSPFHREILAVAVDARAALACTPAGVPNGVQQTEEIVRLREALTLALDFIKGIGVTPKPKWWRSARAALACRPQGEKS